MRRRHCLWWFPLLVGCVDEPAAKDSPAPVDTADSAPIEDTGDSTPIEDTGDSPDDTGTDLPPTVTVTAPVDGDTVSGVVPVEALATDDNAVERVELSVDGGVVYTTTVAPYAWSWDTCEAAKGEHTLSARAVDSGGNEATDAVDVTVDQGLEVELISPAGTLSPSELLEAYVSDDDTIATVTYDLDGAVVATLSAATGSADACSLTCACTSFASTWDVTSAPEGDHVLTVTVTNAVGDIATAATGVTIDHDLDGDGDPGTAWAGGDCDDSDPRRSSTTAEIVADGIDQDCDGVDTCHVDADGDTFGTDVVAAGTSLDCTDPGFARVGGDCDDADATAWPGASEVVADGVDQDCDGVDACYTDADGDEFGTSVVSAGSSLDCLSGAGAMEGTDCDDASADDHPGADEVVANGDDEDCDGVDACYADADDDGYGTTEVVTGSSLSCTTGTGAAVSTDCDDEVARTNPGATEVCGDGVDNDCDGEDSAVCEITVADAHYYGEAEDDHVGDALAGAGDVNGDGYDDMLIGAPDAGSIDAGAAYLVLGGPTPTSATLSSAAAKYSGGWTDLGAGNSVAGVGDVDGDGYGDMLIGVADQSPGTAYLIRGSASPSSRSLSSADATFTGDDNAAGYAVGGGGDVDGDGVPDLLVGAYADDDGGADAGAIYVVPGGPGLATAALADVAIKLTGEVAGDWLGFAVADAGDVDGDGVDDILAGGFRAGSVAYEAGVAYVILGGAGLASRPLDDGDAQYDGQEAYDDVGISVAGAGDVDADGYDDVLVGARGIDNAYYDAVGAMYLLRGASVPDSRSVADADAEYLGDSEYDYAGRSVAGPGDVDGDGYADLLTGARGADRSTHKDGEAYLIFGSSAPASMELMDADVAWYTTTYANYLAECVGAPGDVNDDGHADLLVGSYLEDDGSEENVGAAYLILGFSR